MVHVEHCLLLAMGVSAADILNAVKSFSQEEARVVADHEDDYLVVGTDYKKYTVNAGNLVDQYNTEGTILSASSNIDQEHTLIFFKNIAEILGGAVCETTYDTEDGLDIEYRVKKTWYNVEEYKKSIPNAHLKHDIYKTVGFKLGDKVFSTLRAYDVI